MEHHNKLSLFIVTGILVLVLFIWFVDEVTEKPRYYLPTRVQMYGESIFLTLPKYGHRHEYSLAQSSNRGIQPFPSIQAHKNGTIVNAVDLYLDCNGTLWVLDSGITNTLEKPVKKGSPKVVALDADSGNIINEINMTSLITGRAQYLVVDESTKGAQYLYISDGAAKSIIVWNIKKNKGHIVVLPNMVHFNKKFDVLYIALVDKKLYLTYFGTKELFYIETQGLFGGGRVVKVGPKDPRMIFLGTHEHEIIFRLAGQPEVLSWDTRRLLNQRNLKLIDKGKPEMSPMAALQGYGGLWLLETNIKAFLNGTDAAHNFRLL